MNSIPDEVRLAIVIVLNAGLLLGAWRLVRRWVTDRIAAAADVMLLWYLAQYCIVAGLGIAGVLSGTTIVVGGAAVAGAVWVAGGRHARDSTQRAEVRSSDEGVQERHFFAAISFAVVSYLASIVWISRYAPAMANDALAYHLPAAVQWLQSGRLGLFHTWFYNPANSYSPLAGSTFIAWLMGPMGNDSLARFAEAPAILLLFFGVAQLARGMGAGVWTAVVLGFAAAVARPFISQAVLAKDDVVLAGFLVCGVSALSRERLRDRLGAWRVGGAIGLFFATKYTAMLNLPLLLLAVDAPWRAGWRWKKHLLAGGIALVLAGPWFIRNGVLTGNPIYPTGVSLFGVNIFRGGLRMLHSDRLTSWHGAWNTITGSYYSPPPVLAVMAIVLWLLVVVRAGKQLKLSPLIRACVLGPPVVIVFFVLKSPYGEVRLIAPSFALFVPIVALLRGGRQREKEETQISAVRGRDDARASAVSHGISTDNICPADEKISTPIRPHEVSAAYFQSSNEDVVISTRSHSVSPKEDRSTPERTLTPALSRRTGRGGHRVAFVAAVVLAATALLTGFEPNRLRDLGGPAIIILIVLLILWLAWSGTRMLGRTAIAGVVIATGSAWIYAGWPSYRSQCDALAIASWEDPRVYGNYADAWGVLRNQTPGGAIIAYDNFFMVYPLFGPDLSRRVVYVPARPGVCEVSDLPFMGPIVGELVPEEVVRVMNQGADRTTWLNNLAATHARYLLIGKQDLTHSERRVHPAELDFITATPGKFLPMLSNDAVDVFEVLP